MNSTPVGKKVQLIYIAGYGHSGSTILETLVCCPDNIIGMGELVGIPRELKASFTKVFMENYPECRDLYRRIEDSLEKDNESFNSITELNKQEHLVSYSSQKNRNRYNRFWSTFIDSVVNHTDDTVTIITDASKTALAHARRPYYLQKLENVDVKMVQIVRHPRSVLGRYREKGIYIDEEKGHQRIKEYLRVIRTSFNWTFSNLWPVLNSSKVNRYVRITFEDLCENPVKAIKKVQDSLRVDLSETIKRLENNEPLSATCGIAGNIPVKKQDRQLKFQPSKKSISKTGFFTTFISLLLMPVYRFLAS
jgi:hypothetical protein